MPPSQTRATRKAAKRLKDRDTATKVAFLISEGRKFLDLRRENSAVRWQIHQRWPHIYNRDGSRRSNVTMTDEDQTNHAMQSGESGTVQVAREIIKSPILLSFKIIRLCIADPLPTPSGVRNMTPTGGMYPTPTGARDTTLAGARNADEANHAMQPRENEMGQAAGEIQGNISSLLCVGLTRLSITESCPTPTGGSNMIPTGGENAVEANRAILPGENEMEQAAGEIRVIKNDPVLMSTNQVARRVVVQEYSMEIRLNMNPVELGLN